MRIHDLYIRFKTIYNMYTSHYIHVQNMRAHNVNVRSFILRSAAATTSREGTAVGAGKKNYNNKK